MKKIEQLNNPPDYWALTIRLSMNAFLSGESFLCLAIKISSWINIYSNINSRGYIFISLVNTKFFTVSRKIKGIRCNLPIPLVSYSNNTNLSLELFHIYIRTSYALPFDHLHIHTFSIYFHHLP